MQFIKALLLINLFFVFDACTSNLENNKSAKHKLYYISTKPYIENKIDTIAYKLNYNNNVEAGGKLLYRTTFRYKAKPHLLSFYAANEGNDAVTLYYTLDSIGVFYSYGHTWRECMRLTSTNDSLNELLTIALNNIIINPDLHCYECTYSDKGFFQRNQR